MTTDARYPRTVAAIDLGATSGRVITGRIADGKLETQQIARFANTPVHTADGLHWNIQELYRQSLRSIAQAERTSPGEIASIAVDSWAVDYGLLRGSRLLGEPFHYRDERCAEGVASVHARIPAADLYLRNGIQHLTFNTVFQLATEHELLTFADRMLLIPDLMNYWLTGVSASELTNASTTGLIDPRTRSWDVDLAKTLGFPTSILSPLVEAGTKLGPLTGSAASLIGRPIDVIAVASHDTASAVAAVPARGSDFAYISCGTWGLVGLELDAPVFSEKARTSNFTNEVGLAGKTRFLHNVMGLWLLSESLRYWEPEASDAQRTNLLVALLNGAAHVSADRPLFDVNDPMMMAPGDIPVRICRWYSERGLPAPHTRPEIVRTIIESLAEAFAEAVRTACELADQDVSVIHVVGGGALNTLLCQSLANRSGLSVHAGPVEATSIGNLLVQAQALGLVGDELQDLRAVVAHSTSPTVYSPTLR